MPTYTLLIMCDLFSGRLWRLSFFVASARHHNQLTPGSWHISLTLLEHSPPTWIDSRLVIDEPAQPLSSPPSDLTDFESPTTPSSRRKSKEKPKPTISYRLKSQFTQLIASPEHAQNEIRVSLDDSMMGSGLQYAYVLLHIFFIVYVIQSHRHISGSSYILPNGMLLARLEARLARPESECIIC
jgi:hypothetical protein